MSDEILSMTYHSCDLVLEVNVLWRERGMQRELILGALDGDEHEVYAKAIARVRPFVAAFIAGDARAIAEVKRALLAQRERGTLWDRECMYDTKVLA